MTTQDIATTPDTVTTPATTTPAAAAPLHSPRPLPSDDPAARLTAVEDTLAILQLEGAYSPSWDSGDGPAWANLFTEDGVFEMAEVGPVPGTTVRGREALAQFCAEFTAGLEGIHLLHTPSIEVRGEEATSRVHFEFRSGAADASGTRHAHVAGHYTVRYVRTAEGWRMAHRREVAMRRDRSWTHSY